ncbi:hypothetical protein AWV80_33565 [Cupriavidus sp. UYMU48A]|nr:hypothetical protein AWV80_33565 [Cupriavidus sp. UYMU48A]
MSTKATLANHASEGDEPAWHLYEEVFEAGVVYLELCGVGAVLSTRQQRGADVVLRLPIETRNNLDCMRLCHPSIGSEPATMRNNSALSLDSR